VSVEVGVEVAVGEVAAVCVGEGLCVGVAVTPALGGAMLIVGDGLADTGGVAHVNTSDAATARNTRAVSARRGTCSPMGAVLADGDLREEAEVVHPRPTIDDAA
jgi:hypothetical protein